MIAMVQKAVNLVWDKKEKNIMKSFYEFALDTHENIPEHKARGLHIRIIFIDGTKSIWEDTPDQHIEFRHNLDAVYIKTPNSIFSFPMHRIHAIERWYNCDGQMSSEPCSDSELERAKEIWERS